jgi:dihydrofolate reductase
VAELMVDYITSLDGFGSAEGWPGLWGMGGPEYFDFLAEDAKQEYALLMGARTYRMFAEFARTGAEDMSEMTRRDKVVFSRSMREPLDWPNSTLVVGDGVETVRKLKDGMVPLRTVGSPSLCRSLLRAGLVDRYRVVIFPVVTGATGADRIYDDWPDVAMQPSSLRTLDGKLQLFEAIPTVLDRPPQ